MAQPAAPVYKKTKLRISTSILKFLITLFEYLQ